MAFIRADEIMKMADEKDTSVIGFNCLSYSTVKAVIDVAEETQTPVLVCLYPDHVRENNCTNLESFVVMVKTEAEKVKVPIGIHLDHCSDYNYIMAAIKAGFTSVMYDGSMLPIEENIANTKRVVDVAHALGVVVEAELGHIGFAANKDQDVTDKFTKAEDAKRFCNETGCDSLAIAIGSAHGFYKEEPNLDLDRLIEINNITDTRLVLHGGSGIPNQQLEIAFQNGINKFNVGTEFLDLYYRSLQEYDFENNDFHGMANHAQAALRKYLREKMKISKF